MRRARAIGFLYGLVVLLWSICVAMVIGLPTLLFLPLRRGRREHFTRPFAQLWAKLTLAPFFPDVRQTGDVALEDRGALFIANHRSWFDPPLIMATTCAMGVSKAQVALIPFIGLYGYTTGAVFFNRRSPAARARARADLLQLLKHGNRSHIFPEGTRTRDGELREKVYLTAIRDCYRENVPVVPVALYGTERFLPTPMTHAVPFQSCRLDIGEALWPEDFGDEDAFALAAWNEVRVRVGRLRVEAGEIEATDDRANIERDAPLACSVPA